MIGDSHDVSAPYSTETASTISRSVKEHYSAPVAGALSEPVARPAAEQVRETDRRPGSHTSYQVRFHRHIVQMRRQPVVSRYKDRLNGRRQHQVHHVNTRFNVGLRKEPAKSTGPVRDRRYVRRSHRTARLHELIHNCLVPDGGGRRVDQGGGILTSAYHVMVELHKAMTPQWWA
jgi:hypothetical protein